MKSRRKEHLAVLLAACVLVGYIAFLLFANYRAQVELRRSTLEHLKQEMEKRAAAIGYFSSERLNDLKGIATGKELAFYFSNKALGMSLRYGLSSNLNDIAGSFDHIIEQKRLGNDRIYTRIDFIGSGFEPHVSRATPRAPIVERPELEELLTTSNSGVGIVPRPETNSSILKFFIPYEFKEAKAGEIVAWVDLETVYRHLIQVTHSPSKRVFHLGYSGFQLPLPAGIETPVDISKIPDPSAIPYGEVHQFQATDMHGGTIDVLALRVPVPNTPFFVLAVVPYSELFLQDALWRLFVLPGALAFFVLAGMWLLLRIKDQNLILHIRLDESTKGQEEVALKNLQLRKEIIEREEAEKALRSSEKQYRKLYEGMRDGFVSADCTGVITECNSAFREMLGYPGEEIYGLPYDSLTPPAWQPIEADIIAGQVRVRGYSDLYEKEFQRKDRTTFPAELRTYLLTDEREKATGTWTILRDISDRKQSEQELRRAKDAAEKGNQAKSEFLANMSHELRTPLHHIMGFLELLQYGSGGELNEVQKTFVDDSLQSSRHLLDLINDILDISKVEAGKAELNLAKVNLRALLEDSMKMISENAVKNRLTLSTEIMDIPDIIFADARKLKQIIYNLLSNAAKFTPNGGSICLGSRLSAEGFRIDPSDEETIGLPSSPEFRMSDPRKGGSRSALDPGDGGAPQAGVDFIEILVRDGGIGLGANDLERIFKPFEQVESSMARRYQGTGLGLALTRQFVGLHGGRIWAESEGEGKGSTFHVLLPLLTTE